jgi:hypothetical protein
MTGPAAHEAPESGGVAARCTRLAALLTMAGLLLAAVAARASEPAGAAAAPADDDSTVLAGKGLTLYAGYQFGGSFTDENTGQSVDLREGGSYALSLDFPLDASSEFQVFYGHQSTEFTPWPYTGTSSALRVDYLHIGGTYFPEEAVRGVYVVGGLGVTRMTPDAAGLDPATRLSLNVGVGYLLPLTRSLAFRFEARGLATMLGNNVTVFCSGGCVVHLTGSGVLQGELLFGISAHVH